MENQAFSTLYKRTKTGAVQYWKIGVLRNVIITEYGQNGTESPQITQDVIKEGKNAGRANATTAEEQALKEARSRWEKQVKKGYVEEIDKAVSGQDDIGGVIPMLAHRFDQQGQKIQFPAAVQPKYDGIRCIAIIKDGKCTLWSRTRKPITSVPHIVQELEVFAESHGDMILDGELYNHDYRDNFEEIISIVRQQKEPAENHQVVQYYIYDAICDATFDKRIAALGKIFSEAGEDVVGVVPTFIVHNETELMERYADFRADGYEGAMVRNLGGLYVPNRSYDLQKIKTTESNEFEILGITEGRGKLMGHAATFVCRTSEGKEFEAKLSGSIGRLKEYFEDHSRWKGKMLTVKYQNLTSDGIPRFPVGIAVRDYE